MSLILPQRGRIRQAAGTIDLSPTYIGTQENGTSLTTGSGYTFSSVSIGTADADRYVVVATGIYVGTTTAYSSMDIAGSAATEVVSQSSFNANVAIAYQKVTTGTTADITVNISGSPSSYDIGIGVWTVIAPTLYVIDTDAVYLGSGITSVASTAVGQWILGCGMNVNSTATTSSITNCSDEVEQFDYDIRSNEWFVGMDGTNDVGGGATHSVTFSSSTRTCSAIFSSSP